MKNYYKAKSLTTDKWVYGMHTEQPAPLQAIGEQGSPRTFLVMQDPNYIPDWNMPIPMAMVEVDENTLCQWTGLVDGYGNNIFEHDIVSLDDREFTVEYKTTIRNIQYPNSNFISPVSITGVVFIKDNLDLFPSVDEDGSSDVEVMQVIGNEYD